MKKVNWTREELTGVSLKDLNLSYHVLVNIQMIIRYANVTPCSILKWMDREDYQIATLELDKLGNFLSLSGKA
jgi:hypothetical protein